MSPRRTFAAGHLDPVGGRVTAGGAPPSSPGSDCPRCGPGPSGWRPGRATRPRASERRKLVRLADELGDMADRYPLTLMEAAWVARLRVVLERLADGMDIPENTEESCR